MGDSFIEKLHKELREKEQTQEMVKYLDVGVQIGKDEARKELHKKLNQYEYDERHTPSHKMLCDRMIQELRELIQGWTLQTIPWEQAKVEQEKANGEQRSNANVG